MSQRLLSIFAILLLLLLGSVACGDASATHASFDQNGARPGNNDENSGANQTAEPEVHFHLEIVGNEHSQIYVGQSTPVNVRLVASDGRSLTDQTVNFEIIEGTNDAGLQLEALAVFVDENGVAANRLFLGDTLGTMVVRASHPWVDSPVHITVDAVAIPVGDLRVSVTHDDEHLLELTDLEVRLWRTTYVPCAAVPRYSQPSDAPLEEGFLPTVNDDVIFENYETLYTYTVAVIGHGPYGQISGGACLDGIELDPHAVTEVVLDLNLFPLMPTGAYDVISHWDFTEALAASGSLGSTLVDILTWTANPGAQMADLLIDDYIGPFFCDDWGEPWYNWSDGSTECLAFRYYSGDVYDAIEDFINDQIASIGILSEIQQIGADLFETVSNMKVESILTIETKGAGESELSGLDAWQAIYFYWTRDCDANSPPDCGEIRIGLGPNSSFGVFEAQWDGRLHSYDQLEIDPHEMVLPYGQIITYILNEQIIPAVSNGNANNLGQLFEYMLCDNLGSFSFGGANLPASTIQGFCSSVFATLGLAADLYINALTYPMNLFISGDGTMVDLTSNGVTDIIEPGIFYGEIEGQDGIPVEMDAVFTAERRN